MYKFLIKRVLMALPTLLIVSVLSFSMMQLLPGDTATAIVGMDASPEAIQAVRKQLGLDQPVHVQYVRWLGSIVGGNLGNSLRDNRPVSGLIRERLPVSLQLGSYALLLAVGIGLPIGILAANRRNTIWDQLATVVSVLNICLPSFVIGLILVYVFGLRLRWLPAGGYLPPFQGLATHLKLMILPAITHAGSTVALSMRMTRSAMLDVLRQDYMRTAKAKGLSLSRILYKHGLRNALLPVITVIGLQAGYLLGSAVITEVVFTIPGLGRLLVDSLATRDYPVVQAAMLIFAVIYVVVNLAVDIFYSILDPRVRYE